MLPGAAGMAPSATVRSVLVEGNSRVPAGTILARISSVPNARFDSRKAEADLRKLYELGVFADVQVQSREAAEGQVDVVYRVKEFPFISNVSIEGVDSKLEEQIRDHLRAQKLELQPATPFKPPAAHKAALAARNFLRSRKYPNAEVRVSTENQNSLVRVRLRVQTGPKLHVGSVRFTGNHSVPAKDLIREMQFSRPAPFWRRWGGAARYVQEELYSDLERIRMYYRSLGFAAARVGEPRVTATGEGEKQRIEVEIPIVEGERYELTSVRLEGRIQTGAAEVEKMLKGLPAPGRYDGRRLEEVRQGIVDALGRHGYALARAELKQVLNEKERTVEAVYRVDPGPALAIGRIEFQGNRRIPDKFLRRELKSAEGEIFDTTKLDKSVERLNKSNLLQEVRRADVQLKVNEETNLLDITFLVKEKDRQGIYATGGTGGINGGYLGILYTAFNFLGIGETISLELDGGASRSNMLLNMVGSHFMGSPFTIALSVFNRYAGFNVANVVPGPESLVRVLKRRSRGVGLTGAYPVTGNLQVGMGFEAHRDSVDSTDTSVHSYGSELAPFVLFDKTRGIGPDTRGYRLSYSHSLDGSLFLRSLDSSRGSVQLTRYMDDPFTKGRNSFAFHLQGSWIRATGGGTLLLEDRFYPGDESVRGFSRGSLSPWAGTADGKLQPAGADTVLGLSTEYRVPIRGPLSGVGFFDLGWTHLDPKDAAQLGSGARLVNATNGVLRASLGGELRLQLPMIRQPARLIFSWNPLRLNTVFSNPSSVLQLADPKTSVRFALGSLY